MEILSIHIHNYRSIIDGRFELTGYNLLVGANNSGKSTVVNAILTFYDKLKFNKTNDFPKMGSKDEETWIEITFQLNEEEYNNLPDDYKSLGRKLTIRRILFSEDKQKFVASQSNLYAVLNGELDNKQFFGAKNVASAKLGEVIYVPAVSTVSENLKMTGPSPLRDTLNYLFKDAVQEHPKYLDLKESFDTFNTFANDDEGIFNNIADPLNRGIEEWDISFNLKINPISTEEITKNLITYHFKDANLGDEEVNIDQYGHGFQRSIVFNLIKLSASFKRERKVKKKDFNPKLVILLFEEPEAFLHPTQQDQLAYNLKKLAEEQGYQVLLTSHSSMFIGKATDQLNQLIKINKEGACSLLHQPSIEDLFNFFNYANEFKKILGEDLEPTDSDELIAQEEKFRYQLWLDSERAAMFFANHVIITEGATEKILLEYLLDNEWGDLKKEKLYILDSMGKYNIHRYMKLLALFGIKHSVILDSDSAAKGKKLELHHRLNDHIKSCVNEFTTSEPHLFEPDLESFLSLPMPRRDRKPLDMIIALSEDRIQASKLHELKSTITKLIDEGQKRVLTLTN